MASYFAKPDRREMLRNIGLGLLGTSCASWLPGIAAEVAQDPRRRRHCILLWMSGGPSQTDTFDMKPGHANGGEFKELKTSIPGFQFSEHLPKLAKHADQLAIVRSLSTKEGDHARGTHLVRTGHPPMGDVAYPSIACALAKELPARNGIAELCDGCAATRYQPGRVRAGLFRSELRTRHRRRQCGPPRPARLPPRRKDWSI